mgnify:CR=1 FL=1
MCRRTIDNAMTCIYNRMKKGCSNKNISVATAKAG